MIKIVQAAMEEGRRFPDHEFGIRYSWFEALLKCPNAVNK